MTQALVLSRPEIVLVDARESAPPASAVVRRDTPLPARPKYVYGDSTPFPHDCDFIAALHDAVECGVSLMQTQEAITDANRRAEEAGRRRHVERARLLQLADAIKHAIVTDASTAPERVARVGARLVAS